MINEVKVKNILYRAKNPEYWYNIFYNFNIYRGCRHACIYCDSRSKCYGIENFNNVIVKINAPELLRKKLASITTKRTIGTGSMSDPYEPVEEKYGLTRECLGLIAKYGFPLSITTKSDMILRDIDLLQSINRSFAQVIITITTTDNKLASIIEPNAPSPTRRLKALYELSKKGINVGVNAMPLLPFINDTKENINAIISKCKDAGAQFIIPSFGLTLRDRQRDYYYQKIDQFMPDLSVKYRKTYGDKYGCYSPKLEILKTYFVDLCKSKNIIYRMNDVPNYETIKQTQMKLF